MEKDGTLSRRTVIKSSFWGMLAVSIPNLVFVDKSIGLNLSQNPEENPRYPSINDEIVSEVVGVSHFDLDRLKKLVDPRPELARATWDWNFGDWESAIGAASHVARFDIIEYLLSKGARPNIFTFTTLGAFDIVKSMIEFNPHVKNIKGPHGISLLQHVQFGARRNQSKEKESQYQLLITYLKDNTEQEPKYKELTEKEKEKYLGNYKYGDGDKDGFSIKKNMRNLLSLGKIGSFGGGLYYKGNQQFDYNGTPSVNISFEVKGDSVKSLTVEEPGLSVIAVKQ